MKKMITAVVALACGLGATALAPNAAQAAAASCSKYTGSIVDQTAISNHAQRGKKRSVPTLTAAVLHQMGFQRGNDPKKYKKVKAHFVVLPDGTVAQNHPIEYYLPASDGLSKLSVAIEFAGNFKSVNGKWYKGDKFGRDTPTVDQIQAGRCLLIYVKSKLSGMQHVLAHRQSGAQRQNDPGPEIWCGVGEWAIKHLNLKDGGPGFKVGKGRAIDPKWRTWCPS